MKLKTNVISAQKALDQLKIESVEKTSKIEALKMTNFRWNAELASTQDALEETRVECVENRSEIQALRIAKIKLETEVTSAQKALEESKAESKAESKVELEKVEKQLKIEAASKKSLEELRQDWAVKVYQSDRKNENLVNLLSLEPEKLFKKYEEIMKSNDSNLVKVEEGHDNSAIKDKRLTLQILQRDLYEKELHEIMDVLKMPSEDRVHANILPMIKNLLEQVDTDHYTSAVENLINEWLIPMSCSSQFNNQSWILNLPIFSRNIRGLNNIFLILLNPTIIAAYFCSFWSESKFYLVEKIKQKKKIQNSGLVVEMWWTR